MAFGHKGLIDGGPGEDAVSRVSLEAIQCDLLATLRQPLRPWARVTASV